jgi:hypothetical protein
MIYDSNPLSQEEIKALVGLQAAQNLAHKTASDAGWYHTPATGGVITRNFGEVVALMHAVKHWKPTVRI